MAAETTEVEGIVAAVEILQDVTATVTVTVTVTVMGGRIEVQETIQIIAEYYSILLQHFLR